MSKNEDLTIGEMTDILTKNSGSTEDALAYLIGYVQGREVQLNGYKDSLGISRSDGIEQVVSKMGAKNEA